MPCLEHLPFDGLEALTPQPQGDVSLEEMREHMGDKVLLDGIPAVVFLRLVLGISDELPEGCGDERMERVRMISEWCRNSGV